MSMSRAEAPINFMARAAESPLKVRTLTLTDPAVVDRDPHVVLPDGTALEGANPVVVIRPNGSGKIRQLRELRSGCRAPQAVRTAATNSTVLSSPSLRARSLRNPGVRSLRLGTVIGRAPCLAHTSWEPLPRPDGA